MTWFVYLLECENGKIYTGITTDVTRRFDEHLKGTGAKFTRANLPGVSLNKRSQSSTRF